MMGEACYALIDITDRKCVKSVVSQSVVSQSVVSQLRIELNALQFGQMSVVLAI